VLFGAGDVPAGLEDGEGLGVVWNVHFLGADRQGHVGAAGLEALHRQVEGRTPRGAGVLDVVDGDLLDADLAQHHLARDGDLALQRFVGHAGVVGIADRLGLTVGTVKWHLHNLFMALRVRNRLASIFKEKRGAAQPLSPPGRDRARSTPAAPQHDAFAYTCVLGATVEEHGSERRRQ